MDTKRGHALTTLIGIAIGALLFAVIPASAGNGDYLVLGEKNTAKRLTKVTTKSGVLFRTTQADVPAAAFEVQSGPPIAANSDGMVEALDLDILGQHYGMISGANWADGDFNGDGAVNLLDLSTPEFVHGLRLFYQHKDIWFGLVKAASFGFAIGSIGCMRGLSTQGGAEGVGRETTRAVVLGAEMILVLDAFWAATIL